ncbi:hypothetical protein PENSPDRAFT_693186 [Peniophora sp. CONT]|nr:hypothetical protein PENSPDRAFT_693186 [Peniophora sp. CONT]
MVKLDATIPPRYSARPLPKPTDFWGTRLALLNLESEQDDLRMVGLQANVVCRELFTGPDVLKRLRETSGLRTKHTPDWADWREFQSFTTSIWGAAGEAVALTLYHLAADEGMSGDEIERVREGVELYCNNKGDEPGERWRSDGAGGYEGNPATAPIVFRAVKLAHKLSDERAQRAGDSRAVHAAQQL